MSVANDHEKRIAKLEAEIGKFPTKEKFDWTVNIFSSFDKDTRLGILRRVNLYLILMIFVVIYINTAYIFIKESRTFETSRNSVSSNNQVSEEVIIQPPSLHLNKHFD